MSRAETDREVWAIDSSGRRYAGADAARRILVELGPPWSWLGRVAARTGPLDGAAYSLVARHRHRLSRWLGVEPECARPDAGCE